ncbi:LysR family transcriptional regulator [Alcaligenaceae bacterium]|nr:LysR family transcriptional regulator [Alcaligenaceae bacterium]
MDLTALRIFVRVAELGSFTQTAEQLGLAKGRVSAAVQKLEMQVGTRLLQRTTRQVRLTADGEQFLGRCKALIEDAENLQAMFQPVKSGLRGRLRIDLPTALARRLIIPRLPEFLAENPALELGISTTDHQVDLIQEGFDCVLRVGFLRDTELVARPVGAMQMCNLASPAYLAVYGTPTTLADLDQHRIVHYAAKLGTQGAGWEYLEGTQRRLHPMRSAIVVNGTDAAQAACLAGLGMVQAPLVGAQHLIDAGQLVSVMPDLTAAAMPVTLLYPHRRQVPPRVQGILNWLTQVLETFLQDADAATSLPSSTPAPRHIGR